MSDHSDLFIGWVQIIEPQDALFGEDGYPIQQERMGEWSGAFVMGSMDARAWIHIDGERDVRIFDTLHKRVVTGAVFIRSAEEPDSAKGYALVEFTGTRTPRVLWEETP